MALEVAIAVAMVVLGILYHLGYSRRTAANCPHFREARHFAGGVEGQCVVSAHPVTDPRMTSGFDANVCSGSHHKSCPTYRAARSGRSAT